MAARELVAACADLGPHYQLSVNAFVDDYRRALSAERARVIAAGVERCRRAEGLVAAVVSALCREVGMAVPAWVGRVYSPEPFFVMPASGFALRVRLMLESPPPFRCRNVFVPENYLRRA